MDWTSVTEWDEMAMAFGVVLMLIGFFDIGFWITLIGGVLFLATEGYLNF